MTLVESSDCGAVCRSLGRHAGSCDRAHMPSAPPDPFPLAALLRAAVEAHASSHACTWADIAAEAGLSLPQLSRACRPGARPRWETVAPLLRVLGLRVALVPAD